MKDDPTLPEVLTAVKAADERKAGNIVAIRVRVGGGRKWRRSVALFVEFLKKIHAWFPTM